MNKYYFTSESVTEGHPDKVADLISDSILDEYLKQDKYSRVAVETFVTGNTVTIAGQVTSKGQVDIENVVRQTIKNIGYDNEKTDMDYRTCKINVDMFGGHAHRRHFGDDASAGHREGVDVVVARRDDRRQVDGAARGVGGRQREAAELVGSLHRGDEPQRAVVGPRHVGGVVVEGGREVGDLRRAAVVAHQALLVGLVAGRGHRAEGDVAVVGRPDGVFVIAGEGRIAVYHGIEADAALHRLADVDRAAARAVVDEDVRIGRKGVVGAGKGLAGVGQPVAGVAPCDLGRVEVGRRGYVPRRVGAYDVDALGGFAVGEGGDEEVAVAPLVPIVPVAGHQIVVDVCFRPGHVLIEVGRTLLGAGDGYRLHVPDRIAGLVDAEALDVGVEGGHLLRLAARGGHVPYLLRAAAVRQEIERAPVGRPCRRRVVRRVVGQLAHLARCHVAQVKRCHAAVLAEIVIGDRVDEPFAVGRKLRPSEPSHLPHHLRGETSRGDLFGRERVVDFERLGPLRTGAESQNRTCHKQEKFFHICRVGFLHFVQIFVLLPEQIVCFMCRTIYFADKILLFSSRPVGEPYHEIPLEAGTLVHHISR